MTVLGTDIYPHLLQLWSHCHKPCVRTELLRNWCGCANAVSKDVYQLCLMCLGAFAQEAASAMTAELGCWQQWLQQLLQGGV